MGKRVSRRGDAETRRRGDAGTRRMEIPRKISLTLYNQKLISTSVEYLHISCNKEALQAEARLTKYMIISLYYSFR
ncbi:MAG: hypothetical protein F6K41_01705 [Symploca sp. SIO3E6]|nr:hypothetical protein [Caldora sp. SIO3E6]